MKSRKMQEQVFALVFAFDCVTFFARVTSVLFLFSFFYFAIL